MKSYYFCQKRFYNPASGFFYDLFKSCSDITFLAHFSCAELNFGLLSIRREPVSQVINVGISYFKINNLSGVSSLSIVDYYSVVNPKFLFQNFLSLYFKNFPSLHFKLLIIFLKSFTFLLL